MSRDRNTSRRNRNTRERGRCGCSRASPESAVRRRARTIGISRKVRCRERCDCSFSASEGTNRTRARACRAKRALKPCAHLRSPSLRCLENLYSARAVGWRARSADGRSRETAQKAFPCRVGPKITRSRATAVSQVDRNFPVSFPESSHRLRGPRDRLDPELRSSVCSVCITQITPSHLLTTASGSPRLISLAL